MKTKLIFTTLSIIFSLIIITGCSSVKFYDYSSETGKELGFLYYPPKPYILIEKGDKNISTKLISLPDLAHPHRVKHSIGFGTAEMGFEIENGMIKSFNSKSDSKSPETITALTGFGTAKAALIAAEAAMATATKELTPTRSEDDEKIKYDVDNIIKSKDILSSNVLEPLEKAPSKNLFDREISILKAQIGELENITVITYPSKEPLKLIEELEKYRKLSGNINNELKSVNAALSIYSSNPSIFKDDYNYALQAKPHLEEAIELLAGFSSRSTSVTGLYEIDFIRGTGNLMLRKVSYE
ncbi:hypothetical protein K8R14_01355 [bacterium]|nr:hypothetical protein [bacterium]